MKRPELIALFAPVAAGPAEVARAFLDLVEREFSARLSPYYAVMKFDPDDGTYSPAGELLDLEGRDDLMRRVARDGSSMWGCDLYWDVEYVTEVYASVFPDPAGKKETTLMLVVDPSITRLVEDDPGGRLPYVLFLCRVAEAIGSPWFASGPYIRCWKPLTIDQPAGSKDLGQLYVVAWKHSSPVPKVILPYTVAEPERLGRTTLGYDFWARFSLLE